MQDTMYKNGLYFSCRRCSACCGQTPGVVYLSRKDMTALMKFLCLDAGTFIEKYCRWTDYYEGKTVLALQNRKNNDCILWADGCSVYQARPVQCSTYPFWSWMLSDKSMWDECAKDCPGMNSGKLWSRDEIECAKNEYDENVPITREEVALLFNV